MHRESQENFVVGEITLSMSLGEKKFFPPERVRTIDGVEGLAYDVAGDGDCGYTAFGIIRMKAYELLMDYLNKTKVKELLAPAIEEAFLGGKFLSVLQGISSFSALSQAFANYVAADERGEKGDAIFQELTKYKSDDEVIKAYVKYDVLDRQIEDGWSHPGVLQALAEIQGIELYIWEYNNESLLKPCEDKLHGQCYAHYMPTMIKNPRTDLLFINNNHFNRLDLNPLKKNKVASIPQTLNPSDKFGSSFSTTESTTSETTLSPVRFNLHYEEITLLNCIRQIATSTNDPIAHLRHFIQRKGHHLERSFCNALEVFAKELYYSWQHVQLLLKAQQRTILTMAQSGRGAHKKNSERKDKDKRRKVEAPSVNREISSEKLSSLEVQLQKTEKFIQKTQEQIPALKRHRRWQYPYYETLLGYLIELKKEDVAFLKQWNNIVVASKKSQDNEPSDQRYALWAQPKVRIRIPGIGYRFIREATLVNYFLTDPNQRKRSNKFGVHKVIEHAGVFYKLRPNFPGIEYMVNAFISVFTGEPCVATQLVLIETDREKEPTPILASKAVEGENFHILLEESQCDFLLRPRPPQLNALEELKMRSNKAYIRCGKQLFYVNKEKKQCTLIDVTEKDLEYFDSKIQLNELSEGGIRTIFGEELEKITAIIGHTHPNYISRIDSYSFGMNVILSLLLCLKDAKADNYIGVKNEQGRLHIVGIDNDLAFDTPIQETNKKHWLEMKNIFFCMPQFNEKIDSRLRQELAEIDPLSLLLQWLTRVQAQNETYRHYQSLFEEEVLEELRLPVRLPYNTITSLVRRLEQIKQYCQQEQTITYRELLKALFPLVAFYYGHIEYKVPQGTPPLEKLPYCYREAHSFEEWLEEATYLTAQEKATLAMQLQSCSGLPTEEPTQPQSLTELCETFVNSIEYSKYSLERQRDILQRLSADFSFLSCLVIQRCEALTDEILVNLAYRFSHFKKLMLIDCPHVSIDSLSAILHRHPQITLTLGGFETRLLAKDWQLLTQNTLTLYVIIDHWRYQLGVDNMLLLHKALRQTQNKFPEFLKYLIEEGVDFEQSVDQGCYLPYALCEEGILEAVEWVVQYSDIPLTRGNPEVDHAPNALSTLLDIATEKNHAEIVVCLLRHKIFKLSKNASAPQTLQLALKVWGQHSDDVLLRDNILYFARCKCLLTSGLLKHLVPVNTKTFSLAHEADRKEGNAFCLHDSKASKLGSSELLETLLDHAPIESIDLTGCADVRREDLALLAKRNVKYVALDFRQALNCGLINLNQLDKMHQLIFQGNNQTYFAITRVTLRDKELNLLQFDVFMQGLSESKTVKFLDLSNVMLTSQHVVALAKGLKTNQSVTELILKQTQLDAEGLKILINALHQPLSLVELDLSYNKIGALGAIDLVRLLQKLPYLKRLNLYGNNLKDQGVKKLEVIFNNLGLEKLDLNGNRLTEESAKSLAQFLKYNTTLNSLNLGHNPLGLAGVWYLLQTIETNTTLNDLRIFEINVDLKSEYIRQLQQRIQKNRARLSGRQLSLEEKDKNKESEQRNVSSLLEQLICVTGVTGGFYHQLPSRAKSDSDCSKEGTPKKDKAKVEISKMGKGRFFEDPSISALSSSQQQQEMEFQKLIELAQIISLENNTIKLGFSQPETAKHFQSMLFKIGIENPNERGYSRKIEIINNEKGEDVYIIRVSKSEYDAILGKGAYEKQICKNNASTLENKPS